MESIAMVSSANEEQDLFEVENSPEHQNTLLVESYQKNGGKAKFSSMKYRWKKMTTINKQMVLPKLQYFLLFCIVGASIPFFIGLMKSAGLTTFQAGIISGMRNLFFFVSLLWGILADYIGKRRVLFIIVTIGTVLLLAPIPFISQELCQVEITREKLNQTTNVTENNNKTLLFTNENNIIKTVEVDEDCRTRQFYLFMLCIFISGCFDQAMMSFSDALVVNIVLASKSPDSFGIQRSFGSIGFGISSLIVGIAIDNNNIDGFPKYGPASLLIVFAGIFIMPVGMVLYGKANWTAVSGPSKFSIIDVLKKLLDLDKIIFLFSVLIMGTGFGLVNGLQFVFMTDDIKASDTLAGMSLSLSFISEFIMFPFTKYFLKYLRGPTNCIVLGAFSYFLRYLLMSYAYNPWLVISFQIFHAFGFALYWAAAIAKVSSFATKECLTTLLAITGLTQFGLGNLVANVLGGYLYQELGGRLLYRYTSFMFAGLTIFLLISRKVNWIRADKYDVSQKEQGNELT